MGINVKAESNWTQKVWVNDSETCYTSLTKTALIVSENHYYLIAVYYDF